MVSRFMSQYYLDILFHDDQLIPKVGIISYLMDRDVDYN